MNIKILMLYLKSCKRWNFEPSWTGLKRFNKFMKEKGAI